MFEHLSQNQIERYGRQQLPAAELLSASDHLSACEACREQVERALGGDAAFFALHSEVFDQPAEILSSVAVHPTVEQIAQYVDGISTGEELQGVNDHLTICEQCELTVSDLRAFRNEIATGLSREFRPASLATKSEGWNQRLLDLLPSPLLRSPFAFGAALALLLLMVTGWVIWQARENKEMKPEIAIADPSPASGIPGAPPAIATTSPGTGQEIGGASMVAQLADGPGVVTLDGDGRLSGVDHLPPDYQQMVQESLTSQRLDKSSLLEGLNRPASALMSREERADEFSVIEPVGKMILADRPTFRWAPLEGATGYVIEVYDETFRLAAASPQLTALSWTAPEPLKRGAVYSWQVKAIKDGAEATSPRPPEPQATFRILGQSKMNELTKAKQAYASSHLILGLLYVDAGLLDEAESEFRSLQKANPDSPLVRRLLSEIQKLRG